MASIVHSELDLEVVFSGEIRAFRRETRTVHEQTSAGEWWYPRALSSLIKVPGAAFSHKGWCFNFVERSGWQP